ncbi:hypothetical protein PE066_18520 [Ramlibacter tataouinensis]|uniref:hypothetical protein n=1 Tax=Ramlibacter tataouinensis TaxID=94132 RepID=UPI0022F3893D|nr:hypothetical protein [Ramlibacter tataouinensis]WBY01437.1 hypothetical protein PE066_18520 [Ramlibacter tataouinensis]
MLLHIALHQPQMLATIGVEIAMQPALVADSGFAWASPPSTASSTACSSAASCGWKLTRPTAIPAL